VKAAVYRGIENIEIADVPEPVCARDGVVLRVDACAICGSDVRTYYRGTSYVQPGAIIGHEVAGTIVRVGPDVTLYAVGDRLAVGPIIPCGECSYCRRGQQYLCENEEDFGGMLPGGFAEYMHVTGKALKLGSVALIPPQLSSPEATIVEPLSSVIKAHELLDTKLGDTVVVIGAGPVGCMHVQVARLRGARKIIQTEVAAERLAVAERFGADVLVDASREDPVEWVLEETEGRGADTIICAVSSNKVGGDAVRMAGRGGRVLWFAGFPSTDPMVKVDGNLVHYRDLAIVGTIGFAPRHFQAAVELIGSRKIDPAKYVTGTIPLEKLAEGFAAVRDGKVIKLVVLPHS
jgi:L-iditol 2-dehydrogenase